jgi:hypothetical protein
MRQQQASESERLAVERPNSSNRSNREAEKKGYKEAGGTTIRTPDGFSKASPHSQTIDSSSIKLVSDLVRIGY